MMKKLLSVLLIVFVFTNCASYKKFVDINENMNLQKGITEIHATMSLEEFEQMMHNENIITNHHQLGAVTKVFLVDEATSAQFEAFEKEGYLLIIPYWGITDKIANQIAITQDILIGAGSGAGYRNEDLERIVYNSNETRPKMVMDYLVTLLQKNRTSFSWK